MNEFEMEVAGEGTVWRELRKEEHSECVCARVCLSVGLIEDSQFLPDLRKPDFFNGL